VQLYPARPGLRRICACAIVVVAMALALASARGRAGGDPSTLGSSRAHPGVHQATSSPVAPALSPATPDAGDDSSAHQHGVDPVGAALLVLDGLVVLIVAVLLMRRPRIR
jgi:hypothetical protein